MNCCVRAVNTCKARTRVTSVTATATALILATKKHAVSTIASLIKRRCDIFICNRDMSWGTILFEVIFQVPGWRNRLRWWTSSTVWRRRVSLPCVSYDCCVLILTLIVSIYQISVTLISNQSALGKWTKKPPRSSNGIVAINKMGDWHPYCTSSWSTAYSDAVCHYLGYG